MMKKILVLSYLNLICLVAFAQNDAYVQANTQFKAHLFKEAIPLYEKALKQDPYLGEAMARLGLSYYYTNNPKKAEPWFQRVVQFENFKAYYYNLGLVKVMNKKYESAQKDFQEYAKINAQKANQMLKTCKFALENKEMNEVFEVKNLKAINSKSADYAPTFYNNTVIFSSARSVAIEKNEEVAWTNDAFNQHYKILTTANSQLTAEPLRTYIGNDINDAPMAYLPKGNMVAITSNNFMDGIRHIEGTGIMMDIYLYRIKSEKEWDRTTEEFFTFNANVNSKAPYSTGHPCFTNNGTTLYFSSNRPGGFGGYDLYVCYRTANGWTVPKNLGAPINTAGNEMTPFVDGKGNLYFSSDWHAGYGGMDVFVSAKQAYGWGAVVNLGNKVNSSYDDMYYIFDNYSQIGYLSSNRQGGVGNEDIYQVKQVKEVEIRRKLPMEVGDKIVIGERYFRPNDYNLINQNSQQLKTLLQQLTDNPKKVIQINGYTDTKGSAADNLALSKNRARNLAQFLIRKGIAAKRVQHAGYGENFLVNNCKNDVPCSRQQHAANRRLEIIVTGNVKADGTINRVKDPTPAPNAKEIVAKSLAADGTSSRRTSSNIEKEPVRKSHYAIGDVIKVANVYYEHGKATINYKKSPGLKQLLDILKEHPHVVIEIGAHTDASGSASYNKKLSGQRANAVKSYLQKKGLPASRLVAKGYGESKPLNRCKDGVRCSKEEHAVNRRTEFKVIAQKGFKYGDIIKVDNINYELNKAKLDMKDSRGLKEIVQLLNDNKISVEIRSHTDSRGSAKYNLELSQERAKAVYDYLVKQGVNKYRLKYKGYGETKPLNRCKDGVRCSKAEHAINRRTDFKVIGLK